jgi:hypothetical protein
MPIWNIQNLKNSFKVLLLLSQNEITYLGLKPV